MSIKVDMTYDEFVRLKYFERDATPLLRKYKNLTWAMNNLNEADAAARLIGDKLPSDHEKEDSKP